MEVPVQDTVEITIPRERDFSIVAELVIGGIAARHDVTLDVLDDIQLALGSLLEHAEDDDGVITVLLHVGDAQIDVSVGPVGERTIAEIEGDGDGDSDTIGLRRLLDATVEDVSLSSRDGGTWVDLHKGFALQEPAA
jgi:hypothetical protein